MSVHHDFLNPIATVASLDTFGNRRQVLDALLRHLPALHGTLLDIGCGEMPYKSLILRPPGRVERYIGLDLPKSGFGQPDMTWDGCTIPLKAESVDSAMATEVFEHCPEPERVMKEIARVLKPGGALFFTVPFLWPLHCSPHDEYRFTPFALERHLHHSGFGEVRMEALGGWDASLGQMLGLWLRRRPMGHRRRRILSALALPVVRYLFKRDVPPPVKTDNLMITGISGLARKPRAA